MSMMFTAKVKDGRLVVDPAVELQEGATVTVFIDGMQVTTIQG